jgi:hypothetical protein
MQKYKIELYLTIDEMRTITKVSKLDLFFGNWFNCAWLKAITNAVNSNKE